MANYSIPRLTLLTFLMLSLFGVAPGAESPIASSKSVDYKRADTNFYARGDVLKSDPGAVILPQTAFAQNGDTYTYTPSKKVPKTIYVEASSDWIEPITPPDMPASLNIPPDAMQIREPQGDVQVAMPNAPTNFSPVTDGMTLPNGAVVKTGTNATAAILFGGVDSARLMPDSEAAVQQTVTATSRSAEVDLTAGGVFSKVGTQIGVTGEFQVHTPFGTALAQAGDFAAIATSGRTDVWVSQGTVELLQPDGKKFGVMTADGTGPLKQIRFPAIANPAQSLQADADSLTTILNFIPIADQKLAALHAKQAKGTPLTANEDAYLQRIKQVPALIKLALVEPPPPPPPPPAPVTPPPAPVPPAPPQPITVIVHANGTVKFQNATMGLEEFQAKIKALAAAKPDQAVIIKASPKVDYAKFTAILDACKNAPVKEVAVAPPAPQPPPPAPPPAPVPATPATPATPVVATPAAPAPSANPYVAIVPAKTPAPPKPPEPLTVLVHEDGSVGFQGKRGTLADFKTKLAAMVKATPDRELIIKTSDPKVPYDHVKTVLDACADAHVAHVTAPPPPPPLPVTAETPPATATNAAPATPALPVTAETPPAPLPPVPINNKPVPAEIDLAADGKLTLDGSPVTEDELKSKLADIKKTNPKNPLVMMKQPKVTKDQWMHYVDLCHSMGLKLLVKDAKPPAIKPPSAPAKPLPVTAETPPTPATPVPPIAAKTPPAPPQPVNNKPVPAEIDLTADGKLTLDGSPVTEDELKSKLADIKKTNPKNPLVMMKQPKVTKDQWMHYVDLCHSMGLKLLVKDAKPPAVKPAPLPPTAETPPPARPSAAEGESTAPPSPAMPAPHLSAAPAPENATPHPSAPPTADESVPVEIELTPDGQISFLGEIVSESDLKSRLDGVAQGNPKEPVLIVKDEKVTHDQLQKVVDICHAAKLKVKLKTVKSSDSGALKPKAYNAAVAASSPSASPVPAESPAPESAASPSAKKIVPVEIDLAPKGRLTFEGASVNIDELEARLARFAKANPRQPVLIVKESDVADDSVEALTTLCQSVSPDFKITVKTAKSFLPPTPPVASTNTSPTDNLPAPSLHMHPSMDALNSAPSSP